MPEANNPPVEGEHQPEEAWRLRIYVVDDTPRTRLAVENLKRLCAEHLRGSFEIEVVDIRANPEVAMRDGVVATPTIRRDRPLPPRTLIGTLSDTQRTLEQLDLAARAAVGEA